MILIWVVLLIAWTRFTRAEIPTDFGQTLARITLQPLDTTDLTSPVFVTNAHDGSKRLFVVEQPGRIKVLQPGASTATVLLDITSKVLFGGEQGLLGLAFHPQFKANGRFFVDYTRRPDGATVIAEYGISGNDPNVADVRETVLLTVAQPFANHNGGMVEFGLDGFLYVGMGDGGSANDPGNRAQNPQELLGKILRMDVDRKDSGINYAVPPDNPFAGGGAGKGEIFALGLRNPWRFSFDRDTGLLYAGDVGQDQIEEIDIITRGGNYGWRVLEGTRCTNLGPSSCGTGGLIPPIAEYSHQQGRCSITSGYVYRGSKATLPYGAFVFADYCTGEIFLFSGGSQWLLLNSGENISSFGEDEDGEIYVVGLGGTVHRIVNPDAPSQFTTYFPSLASTSGLQPGQNLSTGFALTNPDPDPATVTLTAYGADGTVLAGNGVTNPRSITLAGAGQFALLETQIFGSGLPLLNPVGWVKLESSNRNIAAFFLTFDSGLTSMDGTDAAANGFGFSVLPELDPEGATEIHVANPNPSAVQLSLSLMGGDGKARATVGRTVAGFGALVAKASDLFQGFAVGSTDYLQIVADQGVISFERIGGTGDFRSLNGQDASAGSGVLYSPQFAAGGGYRTTVSVINLDAAAGDVTLSLMNDDGTLAAEPSQVTIPGNGKVSLADPGLFHATGTALSQGYLTIRSSGPRLAGSIAFGDPQGKSFSAALPLAAGLKKSLIFSQVASGSLYFTGIALVNPASGDAHAQMILFDKDGVQLSVHPVTLKANGRVLGLLTEFFPILLGKEISAGYLRITSDSGLASFAVFGTNGLVTLAAIPAQGN
jgi:hypothetical protein